MNRILPLSDWCNSDKMLISGPCSAESYEQLHDTAQALLKNNQISYLRAGIWKPRTRPGSFQGVGEQGLEWLKDIKQEFGIKVITEVATAEHVAICLKNNIDALWIGARTVSNPFSVQQIADELKGVDIPIFVKNPMNPDIELWIGALERLCQSGIRKLGAIHRGFYPLEKAKYRNIPKWEIALDLKTRYPNLTLICDPSHIAGRTGYIYEIAQYAMDLSYDGLMIEVHNNPKLALSDKNQQLTPEEFHAIFQNLTFKSSDISKFESEILTLRSQIDSIDFQLLELLAERMKMAVKIGQIKKEHNLTIFQLRRWKDILESRLKAGDDLQLNKQFIQLLLEMVHREAIRVQTEE